MAKVKTIVNGYTVPGGYSGVAVRHACETVLKNPGITQKDLLEAAVKCSGLNLGTAGWITSPGPKSPATLLWDRQKEKVFKCYPNEHTDKVIGAETALFDEVMGQAQRGFRGVKYRPKVGDLILLTAALDGKVFAEGLFIGYSFGRMASSDPIYNSVEAITETRPRCIYGDRVFMDVVENGTGRRLKHWMFGTVRPA